MICITLADWYNTQQHDNKNKLYIDLSVTCTYCLYHNFVPSIKRIIIIIVFFSL